MLELPSLRAAVRHSRWVLLEGVIVPFGVFYLMLVLTGIRGACVGGMAWSLVALGRRVIQRKRVPATLIIGTVMLGFRTGLTVVTGSAFLYFAQPTATTVLFALIVLATAGAGRPIIERLAHDFCPLDPAFVHRPSVRRFFVQVSVLWGAVFLVNGGFVMWLLLTTSVRTFVLERTIVTWLIMGTAIVVSIAWFIRAMRREKVHVRFSGRVPVRVPA